MKTWLQTVDVHFKNSSTVYHTLELAPVPKGGLCSYIKDDVVYSDSVKKIVWEWDGTITETEKETGTVKIWYPRPTLADAIAYKDTYGTHGSFFQFHRDGSVEAYCYDASYYWSAATYEAEPLRANYGPDENMGYWY
jgi:hypothetical protein